jgi:predicted ATPase
VHIIDEIEVRGFRDRQKPIVMKLDPGVNFLIGRNGTGKTTLINLVNAALTADERALNNAPFESISIKLKEDISRKRPSIIVRKADGNDKDRGIYYSIKKSGASASLEHFFPKYDQHYIRYIALMSPNEDKMSPNLIIREALKELLKISSLSVHRTTNVKRLDSEKEYDSTIDKKLDQINNDFAKYFSTLDKKVADENETFQQNYFLSFLYSGDQSKSISSLSNLNIEAEKTALESIFTQFRMKPARYTVKLDNHFRQLKKAQEKISGKDTSNVLGINDIVTIMDTQRIHGVVQEWHKLVDKHKQIYEPKDTFVRVVSSLFYKKRVDINNRNSPIVVTLDGQPVSIFDLSSGEKQLFILLGETLLQEKAPCIFLADEPELSLHVDWQVRLVPTLREINPNAQVIFATHSPDIVGAYQNATIDLENI